MSLIEALIAIAAVTIVAASTMAGFMYIQYYTLENAYRTGSQRVLQSYTERVMSIPTDQLTDNLYTNYNYSGLRVTSLAGTQQQAALTNATVRSFPIFIPTNQTTLAGRIATITTNEDAVLAYTTSILVTNGVVTNRYMGQSIYSDVKQVRVSTFWVNNKNRIQSNSVTLLRIR